MERMETERNAKKVYVGECVGSPSVSRLWNHKGLLKKKKRGFGS